MAQNRKTGLPQDLGGKTNPTELTGRILSSKGLRATVSRSLVLEAVLEARKPLSAHDIHAEVNRTGGRTGIATIYRTLALLQTSGIVNKVQGVNQILFEAVRSDAQSHVVCSKCGKIDDVADPEIEKIKEKVFRKSGYSSGNHSVTFYADCHREECD